MFKCKKFFFMDNGWELFEIFTFKQHHKTKISDLPLFLPRLSGEAKTFTFTHFEIQRILIFWRKKCNQIWKRNLMSFPLKRIQFSWLFNLFVNAKVFNSKSLTQFHLENLPMNDIWKSPSIFRYIRSVVKYMHQRLICG